METKWLEDFVSLAETRSFSRSAQVRHVTQPAFSRRIQALEAWTGIDLIDRTQAVDVADALTVHPADTALERLGVATHRPFAELTVSLQAEVMHA